MTTQPKSGNGSWERQSRPISLDDYMRGVEQSGFKLDGEMRDNASNLLTRVNRFLQRFGQYRKVRSGYRTEGVEAQIPIPSPRSKHLTAQAVDLEDPEGDLDQFMMDNQHFLESCGLWAEHPATTKGYCHLQSVPPLSGRRVFYP